MEIINSRLDTIEYFIQPSVYDSLSQVRESLKHIKNTKRILNRIEKSCLPAVNDWLNLYTTLYCFKAIYEYCLDLENADHIKIIRKVRFK